MPFPCKRGGGGRDEDGSWIPPDRQTFCLKVGFEVTGGGGGGGYKHWAAWSGSHKDRALVSHEPVALLVSRLITIICLCLKLSLLGCKTDRLCSYALDILGTSCLCNLFKGHNPNLVPHLNSTSHKPFSSHE